MPLGGSLRASRAAQLARPAGPLAAVDLADGRALLAELQGSLWVAVADGEDTLALPAATGPAPEDDAPVPRRRRLGTAVVLAAVVGAAAVALATGFSGAPAPAVAGRAVQPRPSRPAAPDVPAAPPRGGHAVALAPPAVAPPPSPPPVADPPPPASPPAPPPAVPQQPPLPELPPAPAL